MLHFSIFRFGRGFAFPARMGPRFGVLGFAVAMTPWNMRATPYAAVRCAGNRFWGACRGRKSAPSRSAKGRNQRQLIPRCAYASSLGRLRGGPRTEAAWARTCAGARSVWSACASAPLLLGERRRLGAAVGRSSIDLGNPDDKKTNYPCWGVCGRERPDRAQERLSAQARTAPVERECRRAAVCNSLDL